MTSLIYAICIAGSVLLNSSPTKAQNVGREAMSFTGSPEEIPLSSSFQFIKIIENEQIKMLNAQDLNGVLKYYLHTSTIYLGEEGYTFDFLNTGRKNVKILIDGLQYWQSSIDKIDVSNVLLLNVDRIEILYGSSAVYYGSNAVMAVINIIRKKPTKELLELEFNGNATTADEFNINGAARINLARHKLSIEGGRLFHYGIHGLDSGRVYQWNPTRRAGLGLQYEYMLVRGLSFVLSTNTLNSLAIEQSYVKPGTDRALDSEQQTNIYTANGGITGKLSKFHHISFLHNYTHFRRSNTKKIKVLSTGQEKEQASYLPGDQLNYDEYWSGLHLSKIKLDDQIDFRVGMEFTHQRDLEEEADRRLRTRITLFSAMGDLTWKKSSRFRSQVGMRVAKSNAFKTPLAYELKSWYELGPGAIFRLSYNRSFRIPTFNELFYIYEDPVLNIKGNPNLSSERSDYLNGMLSIENGVFSMLTNIIWLGTSDGIQLARIDDQFNLYSFINNKRSKLITQSIQVGLDYPQFRTSFALANTGINQFPKEVGTYYFFQEIATTLAWNTKDQTWTTMAMFKWNGKRNEVVLTADDELEDYSRGAYSLLDLSVQKSFKGTGFSFTFGAKNLLDVNMVSGNYLPLERINNQQINNTVPLNVDFGRRFWANIAFSW